VRHGYRLIRHFRATDLDEAAQKHWRQAVAFEHLDVSQRSTAELLKAVREHTLAAMLFAMSQAWALVLAFLGYEVLQWLTKTWPDVPADKLLAGIPGNKTTEGALDLYRLSLIPDRVRETFLEGNLDDLRDHLQATPEGRKWLIRFNEFLKRYGHRGIRELDLAEPRWQENQTFVFQMIRNYLQLDEADTTPVEHFDNMAKERKRLTALVTDRLSQGFWGKFLPWKRWLFKKVLTYVHTAMPFRENFKYYLLKVFPGVRRIFAEIGRRLKEAGYLATADEVYFLTVPELEAWAQGTGADHPAVAQRITQRKEEWRAYQTIQPPCVVRSDGRPVAVTPVDAQGMHVLHGVPASSGKITGKARIITDPADSATFNKGEILVAPFTDPGWTPLFLTASALVMEVGGMMCHGAVVAREYGIPAIVGVKDALKRIHNGDEITVDGDLGRVVLS
jgi:pyruvate,water dikinase